MRQTLVAVALAALVVTAGCAGLGGDGGDSGDETPDGIVAPSDQAANATDVTQTVQLSVSESAAGSEWSSLTVEYPREHFTVDSARHENVTLGVDPNDDGEVEQSFNASHVSGVNNNAYSFTIELDTDYTLETGDVVVVEYPAIDNPAETGDYGVTATLNERQTINDTITVT